MTGTDMRWLRALYRTLPARWRERALDWLVWRGRFVALYYACTSAFVWEQRAVLYGRIMHEREVASRSGEGMRYSLRRGVHRLEKGMTMRPRRERFAEGFIGQTVEQFASLAQGASRNGGNGDPLLAWSGDVLNSYFSAVGSSPVIDQARDRYRQVIRQTRLQPGAARPHRCSSSASGMSYEDLLALARRRHSVRWYQQKIVPREVIDRALEVARCSPSACNRQPFEFRIYDDPMLAQKIGGLPMGTASFSEQFPCVVVLVGKMRAFPEARDRHVIYVDAGLAAMAFELALEAQGVGSCSINWPEIPHLEARMRKALKLELDERPIMLISLGYPDPEGEAPFSQKKSLDELRSYNRT